MRKRVRSLLLAAALALSAPPAALGGDPPSFRGRAVVVANGDTGEVLYANNAHRRVPIASITKVMTALVTLERARPSDTVRVRGPAPSIGESTIDLRAGERLPVRDLLAAALVQSANDAAYALATHVGGGSVKAFVRLMNARARELGLEETRYARPDGLDTPAHYSSAFDTLTLARVAMEDRRFRRLVAVREARIAGGRVIRTWNDLLGSFPGLVGVKTGHTNAAGWSQVAAAERGELTIYAVLLGAPTRAQRNEDLAELLEWGFEQYGRVLLVDGGHRYASAAVPFSDDRVELVAARDARAVVRLGRPLVQRIIAPEMVDPPVERGEQVGDLLVLDGARVVARRPLVAGRAVGDPGFRARARWYAGRAFDEAEGMLDALLPG